MRALCWTRRIDVESARTAPRCAVSATGCAPDRAVGHTAEMVEPAPVVVVVEDDPAISDLVELYLRRDGYRVHAAADAERGPPG